MWTQGKGEHLVSVRGEVKFPWLFSAGSTCWIYCGGWGGGEGFGGELLFGGIIFIFGELSGPLEDILS